MGVTYGKKKDLPGGSETHENGSVLQENQNEEKTQWPELLDSPSQPQSEEETTDLITLQKPLNPFTAPQSRQELHKELQMTNKRRPSQERKSELQQALEKRKWEQRMEAGRDQEEAKKNTSPLHRELLEGVEREGKGHKGEEPEFLRVKERVKRTAGQDAGDKRVL